MDKGKRKKHPVVLQLEPELYDKLKSEADRLYTPVTTLVRLWIVENILKNERKDAEKAF
jgi:hypothetical protein